MIPDIELEAWEMMQEFADQKFSFTDCVSFVFMQRLKLILQHQVCRPFGAMRDTICRFPRVLLAVGFSLRPRWRQTGLHERRECVPKVVGLTKVCSLDAEFRAAGGELAIKSVPVDNTTAKWFHWRWTATKSFRYAI